MVDNWNDFELRLKDILKNTKYTYEVYKYLCLVLIKENNDIKAYIDFTDNAYSITKEPDFNIGIINWDKLVDLVESTDCESLWEDDE